MEEIARELKVLEPVEAAYSDTVGRRRRSIPIGPTLLSVGGDSRHSSEARLRA